MRQLGGVIRGLDHVRFESLPTVDVRSLLTDVRAAERLTENENAEKRLPHGSRGT